MTWRGLVAVLVIVLFAVGLPASAVGSRPATKAEIRSIEVSLRRQSIGGGGPLRWVSISTVAPGWAKVASNEKPYSFTVFHRKGTRWLWVGYLDVTTGQPFDGFCAFMPTPVVFDLFRIHCPPYQAVHARRASNAIQATLRAAMLVNPTIKQGDGGDPSRVNLFHPCVSRLDPRWAGGVADFPDTGWIVWFHKTHGRWHLIFASGSPPYPPHGPVLSLASCVGYNAANYGA